MNARRRRRGRQRAAQLLLSLMLCSGYAAAAPPHPTLRAPARSSLPRIRLIATGGTIANRAAGRLTADELLRSVPAITGIARPESEQFANAPSATLSLDQWLALARRIDQVCRDDADLSAVVVTSGTDTLEELAYFLHLTVRTDKPVVIVGAMRSPDIPGYDGGANLLAGFRVAAEPASRGKGVLVVLNDEINSAREVTKTDARRVDTFQTRGYGVLGVVDPDRVVYYRSPARRHTRRSEFDISTIKVLPRVDVALVYQGAAGDIIRSMVDQGAKGIVIAGAGAGALSGTQEEAVDDALGRHVVVVVSSRAGSGRIAASPPERAAVPIHAEDLAPLKARVLLMLALTKTRNPDDIQRMFAEY